MLSSIWVKAASTGLQLIARALSAGRVRLWGLRGLAGALALTSLLSACFETGSLSDAADRGIRHASGPDSVQVLRRSVTVAGPAGYCVDVEATRESDIEAFVLLVRCHPTMRPAPVLSATITSLSVPESDDPATLRRLAAFLNTSPGRAQLSRSGDPEDVTLESVEYRNSVIWLHITDSGNPESFDPTYWRAILAVNGQVVTLSVLSAQEHPVDTGTGRSILADFVRQMHRANT